MLENGKEKVAPKTKITTKFDNYMKLSQEDTEKIDESLDPNNELTEEEDDYFIKKDNVQTKVDVKKDSIRNSTEYKKHIVVCGTHPSLYYFILPLRARYLGKENMKYIVILAPDIDKELWESISRFENLITIIGSPLNVSDLYRANIEYADKAVILDSDHARKDDMKDEMIDSESVFIYKAIKKCNKDIQIMTELVYDTNIEFLLPKNELRSLKKQSSMSYQSTSLFAAGEVYISSIIDTLTCQAFYNPHIVTVLHQLLTGGKNTSNFTLKGICENVGLHQSNLWQVNVPDKFINKTFAELFGHLAEEDDTIVLGLYRLQGSSDNENPYVYTNPYKNTILTHRDKLFLLCFNIQKFNSKYSNSDKMDDSDFVVSSKYKKHGKSVAL